jgi:uncharacterized protein (TIGR02996 family)
MPDLPAILNAIREKPDDGPRWLALASWLWDNGRDDEAAAVRVLWPIFRDNLGYTTLDATLKNLEAHAPQFGNIARLMEARVRPGARK